jgi:polyphenol oxidase
VTLVPMLTSPLLASLSGVRHGFFTRRGGISKDLYDSLNVGPGSADDSACVLENRRRAAATFGAPAWALCTCDQVHSARVVVAESFWIEDRPRADGVITARAGLICGALSADCAPVLIADAGSGVVAAVHAGWRGALEGVIASAVDAMLAVGAEKACLAAAVGPCIGPASYEVGQDFVDRFESQVPQARRFFKAGVERNKRLFDLPGFVLWRLAEAGVARAEWIGQDTLANEEEFFSNRRAFKRGECDYGRLLSAIMLQA